MFTPSQVKYWCKGLRGFSSDATLAILQHHERLDGSGYPNALQGESITVLARVLAVADVAEAAIRRFDLLRVEMLFRLGQKRFDASVVNALRDLLHITSNDAQEMRLDRNATAQVAHVIALLDDADHVARHAPSRKLDPESPIPRHSNSCSNAWPP